MSYPYRAKKRKACHFILEYLVKHDVPRDPSWEPLVDREKKISIETIKSITKYGFEIIYPAVYLLSRNNHIEYNDPNGFLDDNTDLELLPSGKEAYYESFYLQENRKDLSQSIELNTKWIIPIISLLLSIIALCVSIFRTNINRINETAKILDCFRKDFRTENPI
jgi:hypothetical protein